MRNLLPIGFVQVDGKYPNLALMQFSQWYESAGYKVEWWKKGREYRRVIGSKMFEHSRMTPGLPRDAWIGGTGIDWKIRLPKMVEKMPPSYTLYPDVDFTLGFTMKGCRLQCDFCCVSKIHGFPRHHKNVRDLIWDRDGRLRNPNTQKRFIALDDDSFGNPKWREVLEEMIELKWKYALIQGINARSLRQDQANLLAQIKTYNGSFKKRALYFAWDQPWAKHDERLVFRGIDRMVKAGINPKHMVCYVLVGYNSTHQEDRYRVEKLLGIGARPFVMCYKTANKEARAYARYINRPAIRESTSWEDYYYNPDNVRMRETNPNQSQLFGGHL